MIQNVIDNSIQIDYWPLWTLIISAIWVVLGIAKLKMHPFLVLMGAAIMVGLLSGPLPDLSTLNKGLFHDRVEIQAAETKIDNYTYAIKWSLLGFGNTAGGIGLLIALAAIVGTCMMQSGAAEKIVRYLLSVFGEKNAGFVLLASGFVLSIPVFFDTVFFLLIPLARAMSIRLGGRYLYFVMAIAGAGAITHSMVPPTPGPLLIAELLKIDLGIAIMAGLVSSLPIAVLVLWVSGYFDRKFTFPMREVAGINMKELTQTMNKKDEDLPPLFFSILPIILPVLLISSLSILKVIIRQNPDTTFQESIAKSDLFQTLTFLGEPNIAMALAAIFSFLCCLKKSTDKKFLEAPLITAGSIILITGAGGAYGGMIRLSGVGEIIAELARNWDLSLVLIAWSLTAFIRIAQGSATVAMITGASLIGAIVGDGSSLVYHPIYLYLAIGFGSITLSWMNDSGFWLVQKLSGFSESEVLRTWTVLLTMISITGLIICLVGSSFFPLT